jgi:hypothetical protein
MVRLKASLISIGSKFIALKKYPCPHFGLRGIDCKRVQANYNKGSGPLAQKIKEITIAFKQ